jgi:TRAP-type uncharacterized transport system fused permease subunit
MCDASSGADAARVAMSFIWFTLSVLVAIFAYWVRVNHRIWYGVSEIVVGLAIFISLFFLIPPASCSSDYLLTSLYIRLTPTLAFVAGIYAIVRGLDNIFGSRNR